MTDPRNDPRYENDAAFRAQYFCDQAKRLDEQADELKKEARRYRDIASRINPAHARS